MKINNLLICFSVLLISCSAETNNNVPSKEEAPSHEQPHLKLQVSNSFVTDSNEHYRGLEIANGIAYISGSNGGIYEIDLSNSQVNELFSIKGRHFRDIDVLENGNIVALAITQPAEIWLKEAELDSFYRVFDSMDTITFLDGIDFINNDQGYAFGDPSSNIPTILKTLNGGRTWDLILGDDRFPKEAGKYAGFAASGTSIKTIDDNTILIGLGNETGKILRSDILGLEWELIDVPYHKEPNGSGVYSIAFKDNLNGVAVGGHWQNTTCDSSKIYTQDGGLTWNLSNGIQEYRSCVTYFKDDIYISTGTTGTDITYDGGKNWELLDTLGYNSIAFQEDGHGIAVGNYGQVSLLKLE